MRKYILTALVLGFYSASAQGPDSLTHKICMPPQEKNYSLANVPLFKGDHYKITSLLIPAGAIAYGFGSLQNDDLKRLNETTKSELTEDHPQPFTRLDDYLQYSPGIAVYGLNAIGVRGKHSFVDRTIVYALFTGISSAVVTPLKKITAEQRPDGSDYRSFPSGHTTTAFASAEFMRQEYKDVSPWYGIAGYAAATATGVLRLYNNKHWVGDVVAGAGIGILSTQAAYRLLPVIKKLIHEKKQSHSIVMPFYQNKSAGVAVIYHL